ncbi:Toxin HigB-2 [Caballeronia choica]|uniref:Toxin HigB-2 n=1 Tax=Caballeronia choica TaxID=326476 RepID=A0A158KDC0_9BURK|nr:hypothetical protein [Caballeronia choica]SAL79054.1 Toxin HigB-2 [Caballeronia choica]
MSNPECGDVIKHTGGLRKMRFADSKRQKGKRGGLRVIYYYWISGSQFLLFTVYDKDEMADLTRKQAQILAERLRNELRERHLNEEAKPV